MGKYSEIFESNSFKKVGVGSDFTVFYNYERNAEVRFYDDRIEFKGQRVSWFGFLRVWKKTWSFDDLNVQDNFRVTFLTFLDSEP
jgi:predicted membrane protein